MRHHINRIVLVFIFYCTCNTAVAQVINLTTICDDQQRCPVTKLTRVLKSTNELPIDSVVLPAYQQKFTSEKNKHVISEGYHSLFMWYRFIIKNSEAVPSNQCLVIGPFGMRKGLLFQKQNQQWTLIGKTGVIYPFKDRAYQSAHYVLPLTIAAQTIDTLYLSMDARYSFNYHGFSLMQPKVLKAFENTVYFKFGIIIGILLLFCVFNIYLFFSLKDQVHAYYALYIAILSLLVMKNDQLDQQFFGWDSESTYRLTPIMGLGALAIGVLMHVVQLFLINIDKKHFLYKLSTFIKINALVSGIIHAIIYNIKPAPEVLTFFFYWPNYSTILGILVIIIDCVYSIAKGFKAAHFILAAQIVFLIGALQRLALTSYISFLYPPSIFHIGMVMETLIISFGLIYQYRVYRKEKQLYLKEKQELQVNFDKLLLESKYEIQEQTLKNISEEIHDNIGQVLSLVKLNLTHQYIDEKNEHNNPNHGSVQLLSKAIQDLRDLSKTLDAGYVMDMGLVKSIEYELEQVKRLGGYETRLTLQGEMFRLEPQKELIIFRMYQEILNNIIKHAKAKTISVSIQYNIEYLHLTVSDDGCGFDAKAVEANGKAGLGIRNLYHRSMLLGANIHITSGPGTSITIKIPRVISGTTIES
jgi:signal transduction histidine kinase